MTDISKTAHPIVAPKKLIEVALPLDEINKASAREKSIRHGHPSTLHLWWARRPLAAARAVLFAQMVNDPSWKYSEEELKKPQVKSAITRKRNELFRLITQLVQWENTNNEEVMNKARAAIRESWRETCEANKNHPEAETLFNPDKLPPFRDPFAGGGSIPLEAQRLGLEAHATDLNPVAVLINKAMIEIPPKFAGRLPVGPIPPSEKQTDAKGTENWSGARGLAEDVRRYGAWLRRAVHEQIGTLYPKVRVTEAQAAKHPELRSSVGQEIPVIAWLWCRTVASPSPAANGGFVPLASGFILSQKKNRIIASIPEKKNGRIDFVVHDITADNQRQQECERGTKSARGANFTCFLTGSAIMPEYIKAEGIAGRIGYQLMAIVLDSKDGRVYIDPIPSHAALAQNGLKANGPKQKLPADSRNFWVANYGLTEFRHLFTARQVSMLSSMCSLVETLPRKVFDDAVKAGWASDQKSLAQGGGGAFAYGEAIATYLGLIASRLTNTLNALVLWSKTRDQSVNLFSRQSIPMTWDFPEVNPFAGAAGDIELSANSVAKIIAALPSSPVAHADQVSAIDPLDERKSYLLCTDPPYFDNIEYSNLSDFFYVWIRQSLHAVWPGLLEFLVTPKQEELIASPTRHGSAAAGEEFFYKGMSLALRNLSATAHPTFPFSLFYAFRTTETSDKGTFSTGWESFLEAVIGAGLSVVGTWPMRTERPTGMKVDVNALASSIILMCRPRPTDAKTVSRREFAQELVAKLPTAIQEMVGGDEITAVAPVDLAQAAIGPGMAIYSKFKAVLEADGKPMSVHNALIHINKAIDDYFAQTEGDMDADTRFCIGWFQQHEYEEGLFGDADVLARAKGTAVDGVRDAGVIQAAKGKVRLLRVKEYPASWDPTKDSRLPIWEACHQMCRALGESESEAGALLARMPDKQDAIRQLAYRLYTICERKGWAEDARAYNELVTSWPAIVEQSLKAGHKGSQMNLL